MTKKLQSYAVPWEGQLVLACRKCQKKLKGHDGLAALSKLKKTVKRHNREQPGQLLHVINVPCMNICPKAGVTVYVPENRSIAIVRDEKEIEELFVAAEPLP